MGNFTKIRKTIASFALSSLLVTSLVVPAAFAEQKAKKEENKNQKENQKMIG